MRKSSLMLRYMVLENDGNGNEEFKSFGNSIHVSRSLFPGSSWWNLDERMKVEIEAAKPLILYLALHQVN